MAAPSSDRNYCHAVIYLTALAWGLLLQRARGACPFDCYGRGTCNYESECSCDYPYLGPDCSRKVCPYGKAWSDKARAYNSAHRTAECSNRGICDRDTGACVCHEGFEGLSCHRALCECGDHGSCVTISQLYDSYALNAVANTYTSWDSDHTTMCVCDVGYTGPSCSMSTCFTSLPTDCLN